MLELSASVRTRRVSLLVTAFSISIAHQAAAADPVPIPELTKWETNMTTSGAKACATLKAAPGFPGGDPALAQTYYDMARVFYQIGDYTGDHVTWDPCAAAAISVYRDNYVIKNDGKVPGYWNFSTGARMDFERTGDEASKKAVVLLQTNAAYSAATTPVDWTAPAERSREVAYAIVAHIDAEKVGEPKLDRRKLLVDQAYGHIDQWFVDFAWKGPNKTLGQFSPFMVGLTAHALIRDWEETQDARLIPALTLTADWLWDNAWLSDEGGMFYDAVNGGTGPGSGAPDLNLLVAPIYGFLYRQTGDSKYQVEGDALFANGVTKACIDCDGKHFDQNYWWSFDYVAWRSDAPTIDAGAPDAGTSPPEPDAGGTDPKPKPDAGHAGSGGNAGGGNATPKASSDDSGGCFYAGSSHGPGDRGALVAFTLLALALRSRRKHG